MDLFEPGSGFTIQHHDYQPGIAPSGLFWTVPIPGDAYRRQGDTIQYSLTDFALEDSFTFLGPVGVPATVTFDITWVASGPVRHLRPTSSDPNSATAFAAEFRNAVATGSFSGTSVTQLGGDPFSFAGTASSAGVFAETGTERNGSFLVLPTLD